MRLRFLLLALIPTLCALSALSQDKIDAFWASTTLTGMFLIAGVIDALFLDVSEPVNWNKVFDSEEKCPRCNSTERDVRRFLDNETLIACGDPWHDNED